MLDIYFILVYTYTVIEESNQKRKRRIQYDKEIFSK